MLPVHTVSRRTLMSPIMPGWWACGRLAGVCSLIGCGRPGVVELQDYLRILKKRWITIVITTLVVTGLAAGFVLGLILPLANGLSLVQARELIATMRRDLAGAAALPPGLSVLASVRMYPARIRCALLPWDALGAALDEA